MKRDEKEELTKDIINAIVEGIQKRKGEHIIRLDLTSLENAECDHYIICQGNSSTQVDSIAKSVEDTVREDIGEKTWHKDGYRNAEWILLDYLNVMVHVFQKEFRMKYDLESLWADAEIEVYESTPANDSFNI